MDLAQFRQSVQDGARPKFLFFWGHTPRVPGAIDAACLSQWFPAPFESDGVTFATAEHFMMFHKAWLFGDESAAGRILAAKSPGEAKRIGREVLGFDEARWEEHRFDIVVRASVAKFGQHPELRAFLLTTGDKVLVEASPMDRVWGIGLAASDVRAQDPAEWKGLNLLGFALMEARARLREAVSSGRRGHEVEFMLGRHVSDSERFFCPRCRGDVTRDGGEWRCSSGTRFSAHFGNRLASVYVHGEPVPPVDARVRFGGCYFCPADGTELEADAACATCGRSVAWFLRELIELNPHT